MGDGRLEQTIAELMQTKECMRCGMLFRDMQEMGSWNCRLHTGTLQSVMASEFGTELGTFTCCGVSPSPWHAKWAGDDAASGCLRCDHTIGKGLPKTLQIPLERARILFGDRLATGDRPGLKSDEHTDTLLIVRFEGFTANLG